jgi:biopolymer transport protein ExbD
MISGINVTPLVDVTLVLLIILMVSSTYIVAQTLKVQLPKAHASEGPADKPATVTLLRKGGLRWNEKDATLAEFQAGLRSDFAKNAELNLVISADREVAHGRVVEILDLAKLIGVTKFAINVQVD